MPESPRGVFGVRFHSESLDEAAAQLRSVAHRLQGALLPFAVARLDGPTLMYPRLL